MVENKEIERSIVKAYRKEIWSPFMKAISNYELLEENDCIAVCISGGKDSMVLAKCFQILQRFSKVPFTVKFLVMDPGYNSNNLQQILNNAKQLELPIEVHTAQIFDVVHGVEKNPCYLCARMRRGYLYRFAKEMGCNKIALGHHFDDVIETIVMNMFYSGEIKSMMPKLPSLNFEGMELIRPLYYVKEQDIIRWRNHNELTFLQCACRFTEQIEEEKDEHKKTSKRAEIKQFIAKYKEINPFIEQNIFKSLENINVDKVLRYYCDDFDMSFLAHYEKSVKKDKK